MCGIVGRYNYFSREPVNIKVALLQSEWVIKGCFSNGLKHTSQDFQAKILFIP